MNICVFGAASAHIDEKYLSATEELGKKMALRGHSLVFGCGGTGLMGAAARGVKSGGGRIHGVIPEFFVENGVEIMYSHCDEVTYTKTMAQRKTFMEDCAEAFIVVPGGVGTLEEFYEILTLKELGRHQKAIAVYNIGGFYDGLQNFMGYLAENKFITEGCRNLYRVFGSADEILDYIEGYKPAEDSAEWLKIKRGTK